MIASRGAECSRSPALATARVHHSSAGELSWSLFPFVVGLFVAVQALEGIWASSPSRPGGLRR